MSIIIERGKMGQLLLSFDYDEEIIRKVKTIRGRKWDPVEKKWILIDNMSTIYKIYELFPHSEIIDCRQNDDSRA